MSVEVTYDTSLGCIVIKNNSIAGIEEILSLRDMILSHTNFRTNIGQLFDSTEGQFDLTSDDLMKIADHYKAKSDQLGKNRKLALVVSRDLDFGRARQYEAFFNAGPDVTVQAFRSISEAREWMRQ